jgi:fatty-acyl-CoA synthase
MESMETRHFQHWPKHLPRHLSVPATPLYFNLEVSSQRYPDKPAVIFYDSKLTYRELHRQVELMAGFLQNRCGVRMGDRVVLQMQNSPQFIIGYYAILRADAAVMRACPQSWSRRICMRRSSRCWASRRGTSSSRPMRIT